MPSQIRNRSLLAPEDAISLKSSSQRLSGNVIASKNKCMTEDSLKNTIELRRRGRLKNREPSRDKLRCKGAWKKLLWVKQSYPDNYTDQETFLEHLQRNPRLQPYYFWPLVADSTVIVQHVCSVIIFVLCFIGIFQEHISPISVVGWGSIATFLGWILWDFWIGVGGQDTPRPEVGIEAEEDDECANRLSIAPSSLPSSAPCSTINFQSGLQSGQARNSLYSSSSTASFMGSTPKPRHSHSASTSSIVSNNSMASRPKLNTVLPQNLSSFPNYLSPRTTLRLSTIKSALLIYFTLLGLSPILKSLTRSTSSDSIWTMSFMLFTINIFFFDYGPSPPSSSAFTSTITTNKNIPASLSTNAALMASTVLASRLPSTRQVFSLTLFSIEVFGLFPVFRYDLRQRSWYGHVCLTIILVMGAGGGVGLILAARDGTNQGGFPYKSFSIGIFLSILLTAFAMGGCSWWLIGLQKYKNEIHGPWDPARPVIKRARTDDY